MNLGVVYPSLFLLIFCWCTQSLAEKIEYLKPGEVLLLMNNPKNLSRAKNGQLDQTLPRNWRFTEPAFIQEKFSKKIRKSRPTISILGLDTLQTIGSGQFSQAEFRQVLKKTKGRKLHIVDLRQESHGLVNGLPVSWFSKYNSLNNGKNPDTIETDEKARLAGLGTKETVFATLRNGLNQNMKVPLSVQTVKTERELVQTLGQTYIRLPVPDYQRPSDETVDRWIEIYKNLPKDRWIYFHCAAGEGRTTTFMTLLDMMKNASVVTRKDIIARQRLLGGSDLERTSKSDPFKRKWSVKRIKFIHEFYGYARTEGPEFKRNWSQWLKSK